MLILTRRRFKPYNLGISCQFSLYSGPADSSQQQRWLASRYWPACVMAYTSDL